MVSHHEMHLPGTQGLGQAVPEPPSLPPPRTRVLHNSLVPPRESPWEKAGTGDVKPIRQKETAAQLGCICTRLGWQPVKVSENFCSHPNPPRLLW